MKWLHLRLLGVALCTLYARPIKTQDWVAELSQQVYGVVYTTRSGANTSKLIQGYYEDPFPRDEAAEPPVAVLVARGIAPCVVLGTCYEHYFCRMMVARVAAQLLCSTRPMQPTSAISSRVQGTRTS